MAATPEPRFTAKSDKLAAMIGERVVVRLKQFAAAHAASRGSDVVTAVDTVKSMYELMFFISSLGLELAEAVDSGQITDGSP